MAADAPRVAPLAVAESLVGPHGADADHGNWHSVRLELRPHGRFELELWRFHESFCYHASDAAAIAARREDNITVGERPPTRHVAEVRVTLTGRCCAAAVTAAVRLQGLSRRELNQVFVRDVALQVGGQPTWWSADGRLFL